MPLTSSESFWQDRSESLLEEPWNELPACLWNVDVVVVDVVVVVSCCCCCCC